MIGVPNFLPKLIGYPETASWVLPRDIVTGKPACATLKACIVVNIYLFLFLIPRINTRRTYIGALLLLTARLANFRIRYTQVVNLVIYIKPYQIKLILNSKLFHLIFLQIVYMSLASLKYPNLCFSSSLIFLNFSGFAVPSTV